MQNNLTKKDIENLNKWAKKYNIEELKINDKDDLPVIMDENEKEYWIEYKKTLSTQIKASFVAKYSNLIEYGARTYLKNNYRRDTELEDLKEYGYIGLLNAIDKYQPDIDIKFKNYALIEIIASIYEEVRNRRIKTPIPKDIQHLINIIKEEE